MTIETITAQEATEILRRCGMKITAETLRDGLKDRRFPFGDYIPKESGSCVCYVYKNLFYQWIEERTLAGVSGAAGDVTKER